MRKLFSGLFILCFLTVSIGGDRLPNQTPENQIFTINTLIDVTGSVDDSNSLAWIIASPGSIPTGIMGSSQSVADVTYRDFILTNGGKLSENRNFAFDSQDKNKGLYNLETDRVLTYASREGSHLIGEEMYVLDLAGNWSNVEDPIRCVFSSGRIGIPAFCNAVSAKNTLININSAQVSAKGILRATTNSLAPTEMSYRIAVSPDQNAGRSFAEGTVGTVFAGSIMEARDAGLSTWNKTAAERTWKDTTTVTGGIRNFQKVFGDPSYSSGILDPLDAPPFDQIPSTPTPTPTPVQTGTIKVTFNCPNLQMGYFEITGPSGTIFAGKINYGSPLVLTDQPVGSYMADFVNREKKSGTLNPDQVLEFVFSGSCC